MQLGDALWSEKSLQVAELLANNSEEWKQEVGMCQSCIIISMHLSLFRLDQTNSASFPTLEWVFSKLLAIRWWF